MPVSWWSHDHLLWADALSSFCETWSHLEASLPRSWRKRTLAVRGWATERLLLFFKEIKRQSTSTGEYWFNLLTPPRTRAVSTDHLYAVFLFLTFTCSREIKVSLLTVSTHEMLETNRYMMGEKIWMFQRGWDQTLCSSSTAPLKQCASVRLLSPDAECNYLWGSGGQDLAEPEQTDLRPLLHVTSLQWPLSLVKLTVSCSTITD